MFEISCAAREGSFRHLWIDVHSKLGRGLIVHGCSFRRKIEEEHAQSIGPCNTWYIVGSRGVGHLAGRKVPVRPGGATPYLAKIIFGLPISNCAKMPG